MFGGPHLSTLNAWVLWERPTGGQLSVHTLMLLASIGSSLSLQRLLRYCTNMEVPPLPPPSPA